jgi:hypothetical protein
MVSANYGAVRLDIHPTQDGGHYGTVHFRWCERHARRRDPRVSGDLFGSLPDPKRAVRRLKGIQTVSLQVAPGGERKQS